MSHKRAFVFGYSRRSAFVTEELKKRHVSLFIVVSNADSFEQAKADGYLEVIELDMTDDEALEALSVEEDDHLVCVMEDSHFNVFLTLSLHVLFPKATIIALSDSFHTTQKLKMAGASKVVDLYQVSANRIYNILNKPVAIKFIDNLLSSDEELSLREMVIPEDSFLDKMMVDDFDFSKHNILLVGMIDRRLSQQFMFITTGLEHRLDQEDTLVCIGYNEDLDNFERYIGREKE